MTLVDTSLRRLDYSPGATIDTKSRFNELTVNLVDHDGKLITPGEALYPKLRSGSIKGLIDMRDLELPEIAAELGMLSATLIDQINAVHNSYSAVPAPATFSGINTGALAADAHGFTGKTTFAVLDANSEISSSVTIDFSSAGLTTLGDVIAAVNTGLSGGVLSLSNGVLSFAASASTSGVAIHDDPTTPSDRGGRGFSHFFGLNDLMTAREASHAATGLAGTAAHGFGSTGSVGIQVTGPGGQVAASFALDFSTPYATIDDVTTVNRDQVDDVASRCGRLRL